MGDISWGAVLFGAAAAVAIVTCAHGLIGLSAAFELLSAKTAVAAVIGGIAGEFVSDLIGRTDSAVTTIARG